MSRLSNGASASPPSHLTPNPHLQQPANNMADQTLLSELCGIWCVSTHLELSSSPSFPFRSRHTPLSFCTTDLAIGQLWLTFYSNSNKSKYCCPGCAARTCSLPCYKRHQQWAQCSGKRDPTKYVKKDQLTTPAGIDHDYNFLTSIERGVDRAEELVSDLGPVETTKGRTPLKKWEVSDKHYAAVGVTVVKAPKGMSRQKQNNTHRSKRYGLLSVCYVPFS